MAGLTDVFTGKTALIPYITAGDPDLATTRPLVSALQEAGADLIELGIPFSDPQADGPAIQAAGQRALRAGATLEGVLELVRDLRGDVTVPLVLMGYYNPILRYGEERFAADAAGAGVSGVIVPDLPYDEGEAFFDMLASSGVAGILMASPNVSEARLAEIGRRARGFVYCVSLLGITGQEGGLYGPMEDYIRRVRRHVPLPLALGFGIDGPEKASAVAPLVDGVVVGSAIVRLVERYGGDPQRLADEVRAFTTALRDAVDAGAVVYPQG
ncbi:MAG: tryptophan synthase subunit alpha [Synergistales bacterium]|nr:tryptophan synthase subunit alpha [Synergistales bacterium]